MGRRFHGFQLPKCQLLELVVNNGGEEMGQKGSRDGWNDSLLYYGCVVCTWRQTWRKFSMVTTPSWFRSSFCICWRGLNFMEMENGNRNYWRASCVGHKSLGGVKHRLSYNIIKTVHEWRDGRRTLLVKKLYWLDLLPGRLCQSAGWWADPPGRSSSVAATMTRVVAVVVATSSLTGYLYTVHVCKQKRHFVFLFYYDFV